MLVLLVLVFFSNGWTLLYSMGLCYQIGVPYFDNFILICGSLARVRMYFLAICGLCVLFCNRMHNCSCMFLFWTLITWGLWSWVISLLGCTY